MAILEDHQRRAQYDLQVQAQRPVANIVQIKFNAPLHFVQRIGFATQTVDLRPAGDAWLDHMTQHVALDLLTVQFVVLYRMWTRSDNTHPTLQDIKELRQFIQRSLAQETPERCHPAVALGRLQHLPVRGQRLAAHGTEFGYNDLLPAHTVTQLTEQNRPWRRQFHAHRNSQQQRTQRNQNQHRQNHVNETLEQTGKSDEW